MSVIQQFAATLIALSGVMALAWLYQRRTRNAGVVDVIWAASIGALALGHALFADGWVPRRVLIGGLAAAWSLRLTVHLLRRFRSEAEDGRYAALRREWGDQFQSLLFWFFQAQALLAVLLALSIQLLANSEVAGWRAVDLIAVLVWVIAIGGESIADHQLKTWRANAANVGRTCRRGLWRYSRHPNYFFEWLHWLVYPIAGIGLPGGYALWLSPAVMLLLVVKVTGIPPTEEQSLRSRGDDYRAYQLTTNAFFPGPPKRSAS